MTRAAAPLRCVQCCVMFCWLSTSLNEANIVADHPAISALHWVCWLHRQIQLTSRTGRTDDDGGGSLVQLRIRTY
jgi:hypothetical protein